MLQAPTNTKAHRIFVAGTRMNQGKTTVSLALCAALRKRTLKVSYIKPLGQRFIEIDGIRVDEDSFLLEQTFGTDAPLEAMSPVVVDAGLTRRFIQEPDAHRAPITDQICRGFDRVAQGNDHVIIEGSGHAGVGSVLDISNARIAHMLGAKAILVAEGGIGRAIDEIALNQALFLQEGVELLGVIQNKVLPEKLDMVTEYVPKALDQLGIPFLGAIPRQPMLAAPNLEQVRQVVEGRWLNGEERGRGERVLQVDISALNAKDVFNHLKPGVLIVATGDPDDILPTAIASAGTTQEKVLAGILITRNSLPHPRLMDMLAKTDLPVLITHLHSFSTASRINKMTTKIQPGQDDKIARVEELVHQHVDLRPVLEPPSQ